MGACGRRLDHTTVVARLHPSSVHQPAGKMVQTGKRFKTSWRHTFWSMVGSRSCLPQGTLSRWLLAWTIVLLSWVGVRNHPSYQTLMKPTSLLPLPPSTLHRNVTHICFLNTLGTGNMFRSSVQFPYMVEWVAGCWAWLEKNGVNQVNSAAIILDRTIYQRFVISPDYPGWNRPFFHAVGIPIVILDSTHAFGQAELKRHYKNSVWTRPFGLQDWFDNNRSCSSLRQQLWNRLGLTNATTSTPTLPLPSTNSRPAEKIQIGFVERPAQRQITNSSGLAHALQQLYAQTAVVSYRIISEKIPFHEQAKWFHGQDIVLMANGAASTNLVFMRPKTHWVELYPHHRWEKLYQNLAFQCGIYGYHFYEGRQKGFIDNHKKSEVNQDLDVQISLDELKRIIDHILAKYH